MARLLARLRAARWVLSGLAVILLGFVAAGRLHLGEAMFVLLATAAVALAVPRRPGRRRNAIAAMGSDKSFELATARVIEALALPAIVIDQRNAVAHVNAEALRRFPRLSPGRPLSFGLRNPALLGAIEACRNSGASQRVEMVLPRPNEVWFEANLAPLVPSSAQPGRGRQSIVIAFTDTTLQHRASTMRADFIANASHELRTPLTSLIGFIDTLQGPAARDAEAREKFLGIMRTQAERMSRLINDLLSLSRIETHQHISPTKPVNVAAVLGEVGEGMTPLAKAAGLSLKITCDIPNAMVLGDRNELYEVFENLIDNAIKYGAGGEGIDVALAPATGRSGYAYAITITDHGPGIPAEHVPRLTERFYRVDADESRQKKGTGLGLAIVKHIVSRHRGLLTIRSQLDQGTEVEVLLPAPASPAEPPVGS